MLKSTDGVVEYGRKPELWKATASRTFLPAWIVVLSHSPQDLQVSGRGSASGSVLGGGGTCQSGSGIVLGGGAQKSGSASGLVPGGGGTGQSGSGPVLAGGVRQSGSGLVLGGGADGDGGTGSTGAIGVKKEGLDETRECLMSNQLLFSLPGSNNGRQIWRFVQRPLFSESRRAKKRIYVS